MRRLLPFLKQYRLQCILAPLFKMLEAILELLVPLIIASIIDKGVADSDTDYVVRMCLLLVLLGLVGLVCAVTAQYFAAKAAVGFATGVRHALFDHLLGLSFTEIDTLGASTMITRMTSDVNQAQAGVNMFLRLFLRSPFVVLGAMVMAFLISPRISLIFAAIIVALAIVVLLIMRYNIPMLKKVQQQLDQVLRITRDNLTGARVIRAFQKEESEIADFQNRTQELKREQVRAGALSAFLNPCTYVLVNLAIVALIWSGAIQVDGGILKQGQVIALYNYMSQILIELVKFANLTVTINKAVACSRRVSDVFTIHTSMEWKEVVVKAIQSQEAVAFHHVSLTYQGAGEKSLDDINFSVKKGQTIGIIGGTGSGKTSLVNLISRYYDATEGSVTIEGVPITEYSAKELEDKVAVVLQKAVLFHGSIADNLRWGSDEATEEQMKQAVELAQASDVVEKKGGLAAEIEQGGRNLSGGQRQRLTIARALMKQSPILILDDSASALDYATDAKLRRALANLPNRPTVFIVSQRTSSIQGADRILVLDDGCLVGQGTHEELLDSCSVYREIYESQFKKEVAEA